MSESLIVSPLISTVLATLELDTMEMVGVSPACLDRVIVKPPADSTPPELLTSMIMFPLAFFKLCSKISYPFLLTTFLSPTFFRSLSWLVAAASLKMLFKISSLPSPHLRCESILIKESSRLFIEISFTERILVLLRSSSSASLPNCTAIPLVLAVYMVPAFTRSSGSDLAKLPRSYNAIPILAIL